MNLMSYHTAGLGVEEISPALWILWERKQAIMIIGKYGNCYPKCQVELLSLI